MFIPFTPHRVKVRNSKRKKYGVKKDDIMEVIALDITRKKVKAEEEIKIGGPQATSQQGVAEFDPEGSEVDDEQDNHDRVTYSKELTAYTITLLVSHPRKGYLLLEGADIITIETITYNSL